MKYTKWMMGLLVILFLGGCQATSGNYVPKVGSATGAAVTQKYDTRFLGVVKEVDPIEMKITLYNIENDADILLAFTGGCDITDQYDQIIAMSQMRIGEMVDAYYTEENQKLVKLQISKDSWEYQNVNNLEINKSIKVMQISENKYQYTESLAVTDGNKLLSLMDLNEKDLLTVKGVGGKIHSLIVTKGHGYIRFSGYEAFIGGYLEIGRDIFTNVTDRMLFVVREGQYNVILKNGELQGKKTITVADGQEVIIDMSEYRIEPERVGQAEFYISPEGADLYINENLTEYDEPVVLNFGKYDIRVSMPGYEDWTGVLTVAEAYTPIEINLATKQAAVTEQDPGGDEGGTIGDNGAELPLYTPAPTNQTDSSNIVIEDPEATLTPPVETKEDKDHTITIKTPVLTEVYINGTYKGTTPVSFTKLVGDLTITLCKDGHVNRSYSITVDDDKKDVTFSLPGLDKSYG